MLVLSVFYNLSSMNSKKLKNTVDLWDDKVRRLKNKFDVIFKS